MDILKIFAAHRSDTSGRGEPGKESERRFAEAGKAMTVRNPFYTHYVPCSHIFEFDSRKTDACVFIQTGKIIPLQIKSSEEGARIHYEGGVRKGKIFEGCKSILALWPLHDDETSEAISYRMEEAFYELVNSPDLLPYELFLRYLRSKQ